MSIDDGGPAYPTGNPEAQLTGYGMTLRQFYASAALQGMCANPAAGWGAQVHFERAAEAFRQADAMIEFERAEVSDE